MLKFYFGVGLMCLVFAVFALFLSQNPITLAAIFVGMFFVLLGIGLWTRSPKARW